MTAGAPSPIPPGNIDFAETAIASTIGAAVTSCYGIVGMASRSLTAAIAKRLRRSSKPDGIDITFAEGRVNLELSIIVEYGTPILTVAKNVMKTVKFQVEQTLGLSVDRVDVTVKGLRVSEENGIRP